MVAWKAARVLIGSAVFSISSGAVGVHAQSCEKNEDCGDHMVCYEHKSTQCAGGATAPSCGPNEKCAPAEPAPEICSESTEKSCIPRYVLPCEAASDCGDGFDCEPDLECTCSGSGGSAPDAPQASVDAGAGKAAFAPVPPPLDGGVAPDAGSIDGGSTDAGAPPACECHPLETKHCAAKIIKCQADAECPSDFSCVAYSGGTTDCAVSKDADAAVCGVAAPAPTDKVCAPRYNWADWNGGRQSSEDSGGSVSAPSDPHEGSVSGKDDDDKAAPPTQHDAGAADDAGAAMPDAEVAACSVTAPGARTGGAAFLLGFVSLALGLGARKRRAHR